MKFKTQFAAIALLFYALSSSAQENRNYSGLRNVELLKCAGSNIDAKNKIDSDLGTGSKLPSWPSGLGNATTTEPAVVERFVITEDREMSFRAEIFYSGLSQGTMDVLIVGEDGKAIKGIRNQTLNVDGTSGMLNLYSKLNTDDLEPNFTFSSGYIKLLFHSVSAGITKDFCFSFQKKWKALPGNETIIVDVTAQPLKTAALLKGIASQLPYPGMNHAFLLKDKSEKVIDTTKTDVSDSTDTTPMGASSRSISLFDIIHSDYDFSNPSELSSILLSNIYFDKNPKSGMFYYLPASFSLSWKNKEGFDFKAIYTNTNGAGDGSVNMIASLSPGISTQENSFLKEFMNAYAKNHPELIFSDVTPIVPVNPIVNIDENLSGIYGISKDKISASGSSSIYEPIVASWSSTTNEANEIFTALGQSVSLNGNVVFKADAADVQKFSVPLKIGIANEFSFGKINLLGTNFRTDVIKNEFPFPIQLKNIHILVLNNSNGEMVPCIYTWTLGNKEVLSHSRIRIDANAIPIWMDRSELVKKIWIEYSLLPCNECSESVINTITSSKSNDRERKIVINSMGILKKFNATLMKITLRSRFLDANNTVSKEQTITIDRDNSEFELGPLYIWNERDLSYEYKITLINDEKTYTGLGWIASKDFELYINKDVVKRSLGANCPPGN